MANAPKDVVWEKPIKDTPVEKSGRPDQGKQLPPAPPAAPISPDVKWRQPGRHGTNVRGR